MVLRLPYIAADETATSLMPYLPLTLGLGSRTTDVLGLLDTGSAVNILPYPVGLALGAVWEQQPTRVPLVGSLGHAEARALVTLASHPDLTPRAPVRLVFAWTQVEDAPVVLGQVNFFMEFDLCFYRSDATFEIRRRQGEPSATR